MSNLLAGVISPCLVVFLLFGFKLTQGPSPAQLLQEGHRASARGDYERAAELYEQSEMYSTDPAEAAFYLAGAKYHLALRTAGPSPELLAAEQWYRCCLESDDPRRPHALCGLGNCLLLKAGLSDEASLRAALACYDQCLHRAGDDAELAADACYNREKARLLLLQMPPPPPPSGSPHEPPLDDLNNPRMPRFGNHLAMPLPPGGTSSGDGDADPNSHPGDGNPDEEGSTSKSQEPPPPGQGNLPPIPDEVDAPPLSPHEAAEHLQLAAKQVQHEQQIHHRRSSEPTAAGVKDW